MSQTYTYSKDQLRVEDLPELERRLNAALSDEIPPWVWRQARDGAIDFYDPPYYGKLSQATALCVCGQARDGTTRFYRVITAYVMLNHLRVTRVMHFVLPNEDIVRVLFSFGGKHNRGYQETHLGHSAWRAAAKRRAWREPSARARRVSGVPDRDSSARCAGLRMTGRNSPQN